MPSVSDAPSDIDPVGAGREAHITVRHLDMAYGDFVIQRNLDKRYELEKS